MKSDHVNRSPLGRHLVFAVALALLVLLAGGAAVAAQAPEADDQPPVEVTLFWIDGCPHCATEHEFLEELLAGRDDVILVDYEVSGDAGNRRRFAETAAGMGFEPRAVPVTIIGDEYWVGFSQSIGAQIANAVDQALAGRDIEPARKSVIDVPGLGEVDLGDRPLLASTLLIGFVDGFNPCSLWVLSILLALVLHSGSRRRVLLVGIVFIAVTTALYGLYIIGVYTLLTYVAYLSWIQRGAAVVAGAFAVVNLKDYFWPGRGPSLSISEDRRPGLYRRMRDLGRSDQSLKAVLGGTVALAVGVSLIETPCTAGFPILWTDLLSARGASTATAIALFGVYMAVFLIDELAVFGAAVVTMRATKLQEHHGRFLKLLAGTVMLALAITLAIDPDWLGSITGAAIVFGVAGAVAVAVEVVDRNFITRPAGAS